MGKIKNGVHSGPSGKIGNLVASSWRGISYLKSRPEHYHDANTTAQQTTRMKMKLTIEFLKQCLPVVRIGFLGYSSPTRAPFHAATSFNYHNGIRGTFPDLEVDFSRVLVTHGTLPAADQASCDPTGESTIRFTWTAASGTPGARRDDTVLLLAYCPDRKDAAYSVQGSIRSDGAATLKVPSAFAGHDVHCFLGFANLEKLTSEQSEKYVSDSMYLGIS